MNSSKNKIYFCYHFLKIRYSTIKNQWKILKRDTEIYELSKAKSKVNLLSSFGVALTGALGIKKLINGERPTGNLTVAYRPYPLYFFNNVEGNRKISVKDVAAGYGFTLFSGKSSKYGWGVYGCGLNSDSQLGFHDKIANINNYPIIMEPTPIRLTCQTLSKITHIGCGRVHSVVVADIDSTDGDTQAIFLLGNNKFGQCGREIIEGEIFSNSTVIHKAAFKNRVKQVECGELTTFLLAEDGSVYGCGSNDYGQLADEKFRRNHSLVQITGGLEHKIVTQISCRCNTVMALTADGEIWAWGNNEYGTVFMETDKSIVYRPIRLNMPDTVGKVIQVSAGNTVCAVLDEMGQIHIWGSHLLGLGPNTEMMALPKLIPPNLFGGGAIAYDQTKAKVISVRCGVQHCVAITSAGGLYVWGNDCISKKTNQTFPVRMALTFNATRVFLGADHTIVMGNHTV